MRLSSRIPSVSRTTRRAVTTGVSRWFKRAKPPASHVSAIFAPPGSHSRARLAGLRPRPNHALTCMVTAPILPDEHPWEVSAGQLLWG